MTGPDRYLTIGARAEIEHVVQRSRFLAVVERVEDEPAARGVIEERRRQHWSARHHCTAFVVGSDAGLQRSNDDGEPAGTAGAPMLEVLRGAGVSDVVAVVTRYFGGVLLGTGGLARAYSEATRLALAQAGRVERVRQQVCEVGVDHGAAGRLEHDLRGRGVTVLDVRYDASVRLRVAVQPEQFAEVETSVAALTGRPTPLLAVGSQWVDRS